MSGRRFQIALSYPDEHRPFVARVADHLAAAVGKERVLYDKFLGAEFAHPNLDVYLPRLYREQSELIVIFLRPEYMEKRWCRLEWRHIRQLIGTVEDDRVVLLSFGSLSDLELSKLGISPGEILDAGSVSASDVAAFILERLGTKAPAVAAGTPATPTTPPWTAAPGYHIFISYRRTDSPHVTGRICDQLRARVGGDHLFRDVESIPLGRDFRTAIAEAVGQCSVLLAVIGRDWLRAAAEDGGRRIDDANDFVHIEIAAALARDIPVIPVLVEGAAMPRAVDLPAPLAELAFRTGTQVRPDPDFHHDMERLCSQLEPLLQTRGPASPRPRARHS